MRAEHELAIDRLCRPQGRFEEAETLLLEGYEAMKDNPHAPAKRRRQAIERIIELYDASDKPDLASEWRERL